MIKNYLLLLLLFPTLLWSQGITVSTNAFTPTQLVKDILIGTQCADISNIQASAPCGIGFFTRNGGNFPFEKGLILRTGQAANTAGTYTGLGVSSTCSAQTDTDLQQMLMASGQMGMIQDASFIKFDFVAVGELLNFNYVYASQDYGQFQCSSTFHDAIAIILTDLTTGMSKNLAVAPNSNAMVSPSTIRDQLYNEACTSVNEQYFANYNAINPENSYLNLKGNTVPLVATSSVIVGNSYSLKFVVGDIGDMTSDSAILIEGSPSFYFSCGDSIEMVAFVDNNNNGIKDPEEVNFNKGTFSHQINNGDAILSYSSNGTAYIGNIAPTETYDLNYTIDPAFSSYFSTSAAYTDITITLDSGMNTYYFPVINTQPFSDLAVSLISSNQPQPGFDYFQTIVVTNNGTIPSSGTVTFTKDPLLTITSVSPSGTVNTETGFTYTYTDLLPNESLNVGLIALMPTIPTVALGDYITNSVSISTTATEINTENNTNTVSEMIVGAYDPNDKMESHGAEILFNSFDADDYLEYTIRFQNTGNFYATRVRIEDELEAQLDLSTFEMISSSHEYNLTRTNNNLVWSFNNIMLPSIEDSEEASQGYVRFRIKPNAGFEIGDIITNQASIFFDFNPAIITNNFATEFTTTLSTPNFVNSAFVMHPNPSNTLTTISSRNQIIDHIRVTDITGKVIQTINVNANTYTLDISDISSGIYLVEMFNTQQERTTKKLIVN